MEKQRGLRKIVRNAPEKESKKMKRTFCRYPWRLYRYRWCRLQI